MGSEIWDILITDATIFDGSGEPPRRGDLAISGGRIAAIGENLDRTNARRIVDASGKWLLPGLLDIHTHFDLELELAPGLPEAVRHGSTTVVVANCSIGIAFGNQRREDEDPIVDCFARVENIPKHLLRQVADRAIWNDTADYLTHLDQLALGPNVVPMIPHSMLRIEVMGLQDSIEREPTPSETEQMAHLLEKAMAEGYVGFSTDALPFHYLANKPHEKYRIPAQYGSYDELKRLTDIVRQFDRVWQATPPKDSPLRTLKNFLLTSGRLHGRPLRLTAVAALDVATNKTIVKLGRFLARFLNSRLIDGRFRLQALAAPFKVWSEGANTPLAEEIPELRLLNEPDLEDREARARIMDDPEFQARFLDMWRKGKTGFSLARLKRLFKQEDLAISRDLADMTVESAPVSDWSGETMSAIYDRLRAYQAGDGAAARSDSEREAFARFPDPIGDDAEFFLALLRQYDRTIYWSLISANRDPAVVRDLMMDPDMLPGFNDSGAHLTNMAFYDGNLRALQIAQKEGLSAVAYTVGRLTREPARFFGIDAGGLSNGDRADLVLINPKALAEYDSDANNQIIYRELYDYHQRVNRSDGVVDLVAIAGEIVWEGNKFTKTLGRKKLGHTLRAVNHAAGAQSPPAVAAE